MSRRERSTGVRLDGRRSPTTGILPESQDRAPVPVYISPFIKPGLHKPSSQALGLRAQRPLESLEARLKKFGHR
jgi:hypothetical protein